MEPSDLDWVMQHFWYAHIPDKGRDVVYARARFPDGKQKYMHREIVGVGKGVEIDHINHNGLDNRRSNLRLATRVQNSQNGRKRAGCSSKYIGVCRHGKNWWAAKLTINYKTINLGIFRNEEEAARVRDEAAKKHYSTPHLNFS